MAYAIHHRELTQQMDEARIKRFDQNHPNLFGDAEIIQEALFLGVGVYSNYRTDIGKMAELVEIPMRTD